jgi:hypothetical protein
MLYITKCFDITGPSLHMEAHCEAHQTHWNTTLEHHYAHLPTKLSTKPTRHSGQTPLPPLWPRHPLSSTCTSPPVPISLCLSPSFTLPLPRQAQGGVVLMVWASAARPVGTSSPLLNPRGDPLLSTLSAASPPAAGGHSGWRALRCGPPVVPRDLLERTCHSPSSGRWAQTFTTCNGTKSTGKWGNFVRDLEYHAMVTGEAGRSVWVRRSRERKAFTSDVVGRECCSNFIGAEWHEAAIREAIRQHPPVVPLVCQFW